MRGLNHEKMEWRPGRISVEMRASFPTSAKKNDGEAIRGKTQGHGLGGDGNGPQGRQGGGWENHGLGHEGLVLEPAILGILILIGVQQGSGLGHTRCRFP